MTTPNQTYPLRKLTEVEQATLRRGHCPFCNWRTWLTGARGANAQNFYCAGCRAGFNDLGPFGFELIREPLELHNEV